MTTTTNLLITHIEPSQAQKEVTANEAFDRLDAAIAGRLALSTTGGTTTLTDAQASNAILDVSGALTSNAVIDVPARSKLYAVRNATSGAFTLTVKTASGTGVAVAQGASAFMFCDGTNVTTAADVSLALANTFTQPQTAPQINIGDANARIKRNGTSLAVENDVDSVTLSALTGVQHAANAKLSGGTWNRIDTAQPASLHVVDRSGALSFYTAPAAANPISWSGPYPVVTENGSGIIASEAWIAPTLLNGWVNYGAGGTDAGYFKDKLGIVHLKGLVKSGTATVGTPIFNLPAGYRPSQDQQFATASNGAFGDGRIMANGDVVFDHGSNVWFSLNMISFRAEQ